MTNMIIIKKQINSFVLIVLSLFYGAKDVDLKFKQFLRVDK